MASPSSSAASNSSLAGSSLSQPLNRSLVQNAQPASLVMRSLYPSQGNSAFEPSGEPLVYRSVTHSEAGAFGSPQGFDPLSQFDSFARHNKELSLNPKHSAGGFAYPAAYQPTLNFNDVQKASNPTATPAAAPKATPAVTAVPVVRTDAPPAVPMWLEPNSHFFCHCLAPSTAAHLYDTVHTELQRIYAEEEATRPSSPILSPLCTVDCSPEPAQFKIACTAYQSSNATPFIVRVFTADASDGKYCVEFQRRQGDVCHFYELFRTARTRIQAKHPLKEAKQDTPVPVKRADSESSLDLSSLDAGLAMPQLKLRSWSAPSLPVEAGTGPSFSKEHVCESVRSLLQMCASPCIDIKLQGVMALADLSCSPSFDEAMKHCNYNVHEVLVAEGCFQLFLDNLPVENADLHRASLTALANLIATQNQLCKQVLTDEKSLQCLYKLSSSTTHQVVRECARVLSNCAHKLGPQLFDHMPHAHRPQFHKTLERLQKHQDAHCRQHADKIAAAIAAQ